jgi:pyridinium-3,5-bisthiocarboxylic acid mononucleotide nickel chelatase
MTKLAYLDCPTGISGDMCLGALVHAGVPLDYLIEQLDRLEIAGEYQLRSQSVQRNQQQATQVRVDLVTTQTPDRQDGGLHHHYHPPHRHLPDIERTIAAAGLPDRVEAWSLAVFRHLAAAEGAVHGISPDKVHFHEVGATDAIVDIVGTCLGFDWLGIDAVYCSPLPTGGGTIRAAHGLLPVPAPAVLKLWEQHHVPVYSNGIDRELVTPTGAAIAVTLAGTFGAPPPMTLQMVGLGAGSIDLPLPNILRLWIGESREDMGRGKGGGDMQQHSHHSHHSHAQSHHPTGDRSLSAEQEDPSPDREGVGEGSMDSQPINETIAVLATQIDDLSPQAIGYTFEVLLAAGALDVFTQPIGMKKNRPGVLLTVLCLPENVSAIEAIVFRETTTLGIRRSIQHRTALSRSIHTVSIAYGNVRIKVACDAAGKITNAQPEYEDCAQCAREHHRSWRDVHRLALEAWHESSDLRVHI